MKNNTTKILLVTVFGLIINSAVSASEEDYDLTGYDAPAATVVHQGNIEPAYDGLEADMFTYNSTISSAMGVHKVSISADSAYENTVDPLYGMTND